MVTRVQLVDGEYRVILSHEIVEKLQLRDGSVVEIESVEQAYHAQMRYITVKEAEEAYRRTLPAHAEAYRELAKGPGDKASFTGL